MMVLEHPVLILSLEKVSFHYRMLLWSGSINYSVEQSVAFVHRSHLKSQDFLNSKVQNGSN